MKALWMMATVALAFGTARADGLTFSGYVSGWTAGTVTVSYASDGADVTATATNVAAGADGYVNVSVETGAPVPDGTRVKWEFKSGGSTYKTVQQTVKRAPYALAAEFAKTIVPTDSVYVAQGKVGVETAEVANRLRIAGSWVAPKTRVTLGGGQAKEREEFTVANADIAFSLASNNVQRLHLLGTGTVSRIAIEGGRQAEAQTTVTATSDGLLEIRLGGVVAYSQDAAYGERPNRDAFCRICTMVAMDLRDANGTNQLDEVFGPFRHYRPSGAFELVYRPWIVPAARISDRDGVMNSRLMLPVRAGDQFTLALAYAEYYPDGDKLRPVGGKRFGKIRDPLWVGKGSHAEATLVFHAFGGEK